MVKQESVPASPETSTPDYTLCHPGSQLGLPKSVRQRQRSCLLGRDLRSLWQTDFATPSGWHGKLPGGLVSGEPFHHFTFHTSKTPFHLFTSKTPFHLQKSCRSCRSCYPRSIITSPLHAAILRRHRRLCHLP